jgi:hypothetical protein
VLSPSGRIPQCYKDNAADDESGLGVWVRFLEESWRDGEDILM